MAAIGISGNTLTGAGFSAGAVQPDGSTIYTKAVGGMAVNVFLFTEAEPSGQALPYGAATTKAGYLQVLIQGDTSQADALSVAQLLATIGISAFKTWPNSNVQLFGTNLNGAVVVYSQSF